MNNLQFKVPNAWWKKFQIKNTDTFQLWSLMLYQCAKRIHVSVELLRNVLCTSLNSKLEQNSSKGKIISETHCSKSSFFAQKLNFDFLRKLLVIFWVKNSWKCGGFGLFSYWQLWFHEKKLSKNIWAKNSWKCWFFCQKFDFQISL